MTFSRNSSKLANAQLGPHSDCTEKKYECVAMRHMWSRAACNTSKQWAAHEQHKRQHWQVRARKKSANESEDARTNPDLGRSELWNCRPCLLHQTERSQTTLPLRRSPFFLLPPPLVALHCRCPPSRVTISITTKKAGKRMSKLASSAEGTQPAPTAAICRASWSVDPWSSPLSSREATLCETLRWGFGENPHIKICISNIHVVIEYDNIVSNMKFDTLNTIYYYNIL